MNQPNQQLHLLPSPQVLLQVCDKLNTYETTAALTCLLRRPRAVCLLTNNVVSLSKTKIKHTAKLSNFMTEQNCQCSGILMFLCEICENHMIWSTFIGLSYFKRRQSTCWLTSKTFCSWVSVVKLEQHMWKFTQNALLDFKEYSMKDCIFRLLKIFSSRVSGHFRESSDMKIPFK